MVSIRIGILKLCSIYYFINDRIDGIKFTPRIILRLSICIQQSIIFECTSRFNLHYRAFLFPIRIIVKLLVDFHKDRYRIDRITLAIVFPSVVPGFQFRLSFLYFLLFIGFLG